MQIYKKLFFIYQLNECSNTKCKIFLLICFFTFYYLLYNYSDNNQNYHQYDNNGTTKNGKRLTECRLPRIDPWDPALVRHLDPKYWALGKENEKCKRQYPEISKLTGGYLQVDQNLLEKENVCQFRCLLNKNDLELSIGPWKNISIKPECDIIEVQCNISATNTKPIYKYLHHQIYDPRGESSNSKSKQSNSSILASSSLSEFDFPIELRPEHHKNEHHRSPDVHFIVIDSVSQTMFLRSLPKSTIHLLERMEAVPFPHLNKVGKNSYPNALAMFFGFQIWPIEENPMGPAYPPEKTEEKIGENYLDREPFIGFKFREKNYRTMMAEDWVKGGMFNYPNYPGFERQPVNHYMRPFHNRYESMEDGKILTENLYEKSCKDYRHYLLDYLKQFIDAYENEPKFSITWFTTQAHNSPNGAFLLDDDLYNFLKAYETKFDNAFLFITGDHGLRFTSIRDTKQGEIEDNNPAFFLTVPKHLRRNHELMANMRENSRQLVTHFDTHATLLNIAMEGFEWTKETSFNKILPSSYLNKLAPFGQSFFRQFDPKILRHCGTLHIPFEFCLCQFKKKDVTNEKSKLALELAQIMVKKMNVDLRQQNVSEHCVELDLKFRDNNLPAVECLEFEPEKRLNIFQVTFETMPGDGRFWGYIQLEKGPKDRNITHKFISTKFPRLNEYGEQAKCIDHLNHKIAPYCYCRNLL